MPAKPKVPWLDLPGVSGQSSPSVASLARQSWLPGGAQKSRAAWVLAAGAPGCFPWHGGREVKEGRKQASVGGSRGTQPFRLPFTVEVGLGRQRVPPEGSPGRGSGPAGRGQRCKDPQLGAVSF